MSEHLSHSELQLELDAAQETIGALRRRLASLEGGHKTPFVQQLTIYQQRIEEEMARLKVSQDWSRALVENAMDAIVGLDDKGNITHWNPRAVKMFGWSKGEAMGRNLLRLLRLVHELSEILETKTFAQHFGAMAGQSFEILGQHKSGHGFPIECVMLAMGMPGYGAYVVLFRDISDRKKAEAILKQSNAELERLVAERTKEMHLSEERFSLAMRGANDGLWDWDLQTNHVYYSPRWKQMLGYEEHELGDTLDTWKQLVHPDEKDVVLRHVQEYMTGKSLAFDTEFRMLHKSGRWVDVLSRGFMVFAEDKRTPIRLVGTHVDITERKRVENEMRRLANIVESTSDFVAVAKLATGQVEYLNKAAREKFGILPQVNVQDFKFSDFHSGEEAQRIVTSLLPQTYGGNALEVELMLRHFDGMDMPTSSVLMSFGEGQDAPEYFALVARDLSREKELQKQVEHVDRLESLGVLAGGIAHDFNNILGAIMGNAELLRRNHHLDESATTYVQRIEESSERAADLCSQMLAYSGKGKFIIEPVNLNHIVEDMLSLLEVSISKGVELNLALEPMLPDILGDVTQIRQVIMNLAINASEAMSGARKVLSIQTCIKICEASSSDVVVAQENMGKEPYVYLVVRDTGCGMDEEVKRKLFDPFFTTKFTGRGLGMSAVLGIVNGHHGVIALKSEVGQGSAFHIGFPALKSETANINRGQDMRSEPMSQQALADNAGYLGTVLVIDDEDMIREIAASLLSDMGYKVLKAVDGQDGVHQFAEHADEISAVLLDLTMPVMDGLECYGELKLINPDVKVILTSGYSEEDALAMFGHKEKLGFIKKPFRVAQFQKVVIESEIRPSLPKP